MGIGVGRGGGFLDDWTGPCSVDTVATIVPGWAVAVAFIEDDEQRAPLSGEHGA